MNLNRRNFLLKSAAAGCAAAGVIPNSNLSAARACAGLKLSLAAYSFNRFLPRGWPKPQPSKPTMSLDDVVEYCASLDLDGVELTSYYFPNPVSAEYLGRLKVKTIWNGLEVSGTAIGNDFCMADGDERKFQLKMTRQWVDYSAALGAPAIRIFAGRVPKGDTEQAAIERCIAGIDESVEYAASKGVALALENHGGITATPALMMRIIKGVKPSPYFGVNFDSGNFHTDDPYRDLAEIAPYAINAQLKVTIKRAGKEKEPADLGRTVSILKDAGYKGWIVLEYEESKPKEEIPTYIKQLRKLL